MTDPVFVDFEAYCATWDSERKLLARTLDRDDYATISTAFGALRKLAKMERTGRDLRDETFEGMTDAAQACESARRITWRHAEKRKALLGRSITLRVEAWRHRRELRKLSQANKLIRRRAREEDRHGES